MNMFFTVLVAWALWEVSSALVDRYRDLRYARPPVPHALARAVGVLVGDALCVLRRGYWSLLNFGDTIRHRYFCRSCRSIPKYMRLRLKVRRFTEQQFASRMSAEVFACRQRDKLRNFGFPSGMGPAPKLDLKPDTQCDEPERLP